MIKLLVDHREDKSLIKELSKKHQIEIKQLITADYIIQGKNSDNTDLSIGIERKTLNDFLNSIIDKRIIQQLIYLKENFTIPLLIIEGTQNIYTIRNFHPNAIRGMLASIAIDYQIPILQTRNFRDTAALINTIASRLEKPKKLFSLLKKRKPLTLKEQQELIIESFPGIGPNLAKNLLKKFKSVKKIINASEEKLKKTDKIGQIKAKEIKKITDSEYL
ncbi:Hef nuclease, partial [Candidatus Woesearchaeota archaeon]|nr:Hef nuclease [Candidatus Woesearchaeota archaeon]